MPIQFNNVTKRYAAKSALRNLSIHFREKLVTAVIGPSGSGKSTLLQHINGLLRPDNGTVSVFNKPVDYKNLSELRLKIGYNVQGAGLFPHLTVARNIGLPARAVGWPHDKIANRIAELMSLVSLPADYVSKYPYQLSGGEQQRVGLCRAMTLNPPILLFDEPFGALDPITRSEIHAEALKLQSMQARTIILVTHDLREAIKLADYIVILNQGQIEQNSTPEMLLKQPNSDFVQRFVHAQLDDVGK